MSNDPTDPDREDSVNEWTLARASSSDTLRAACAGEGLPTSGTKEDIARRLVEAGLTRDQVEAKYGLTARRETGLTRDQVEAMYGLTARRG